MKKTNYLNKSRDIIFTSLYYKLGFKEIKPGFFIKSYKSGEEIKIYAEEMRINFKKVSVINGKFILNEHKNFVILEAVDRLLELEYSPSSIIIDLDNDYDIFTRNIYIKCFERGSLECNKEVSKSDKFYSVYYESRLVAGMIERNYFVDYNNKRWDLGVFENKYAELDLKNKVYVDANDDFEFEGTTLIKYKGNDEIVKIPSGTTKLSVGVFWDNQIIKKVIFPKSILNIGGDTFYNCNNLEEVTIPKNCNEMGDNPFAGCSKLKLINKSPNFIYEDGALYNKTKDTIIYFDINSKKEEFVIPETVSLIGKHAFYMSKLKNVVIPKSVTRLANNPFSAAINLHIENHSENYEIIDDVIYTKDFKKVIGSLNSIDTDCLVLKNVEEICKNSFFNCKNLRKIILPKTLKKIGYNPFVGCNNLHIESNSENFIIENEVLFNKDKSKLIRYPAYKKAEHYDIQDSVRILERGAFSFCNNLKTINLKHVNIINKSCFTGCSNLAIVYIPDYVLYIGEWSFAHCKSLKEISVFKDTQIDSNVIKNSDAKLTIRDKRSNYLIQSDNIYTLKSLNDTFKNKVDVIYIDPPYNTEIDYIGYKDGDYKSGYLNFIKERLDLSYNLLSNEGFLIISIDYNEVDNLEKLCKTIFGENLVKVHKWKKTNPYFDKNRVILNPNKVQREFEYIIICRKSVDSIFGMLYQPNIIDGKYEEKESLIPEIFDFFGTTSSAKDEIAKVFGDRTYFSTPKPIKLIEEILRATTKKDSIVLDYFAGSGTTGVAVDKLNKSDNGNRKFILVTNNESNICEKVTKMRLEHENIDFEYLK